MNAASQNSKHAMNVLLKILMIGALLGSTCSAQDTRKYDFLFAREAKRFDVPFELLKAIAVKESGLNPKAINSANANGSIDRGLMQINSVHLSRYSGLDPAALFIPEINVYLGAKILRACIDRRGFNWKALNCYNGKIYGNTYSQSILQIVKNERKKYAIKQRANSSLPSSSRLRSR